MKTLQCYNDIRTYYISYFYRYFWRFRPYLEILTHILHWVPKLIHDVRYTPSILTFKLLGPLVVTSHTKTLNCDISSLENDTDGWLFYESHWDWWYCSKDFASEHWTPVPQLLSCWFFLLFLYLEREVAGFNPSNISFYTGSSFLTSWD